MTVMVGIATPSSSARAQHGTDMHSCLCNQLSCSWRDISIHNSAGECGDMLNRVRWNLTIKGPSRRDNLPTKDKASGPACSRYARMHAVSLIVEPPIKDPYRKDNLPTKDKASGPACSRYVRMHAVSLTDKGPL